LAFKGDLIPVAAKIQWLQKGWEVDMLYMR
jgi:hypothetical protein